MRCIDSNKRGRLNWKFFIKINILKMSFLEAALVTIPVIMFKKNDFLKTGMEAILTFLFYFLMQTYKFTWCEMENSTKLGNKWQSGTNKGEYYNQMTSINQKFLIRLFRKLYFFILQNIIIFTN